MGEQKTEPAARRARLITTYEGKYLNLRDMTSAVNDPAFVHYCAEMLVVARKDGAPVMEGLKMVLACALTTLSGDLATVHPGKKSEV